MSDPIPLYQELQIPVAPPELLKELAEQRSKKEQTWQKIVIDLNGDEPEQRIPSNRDS